MKTVTKPARESSVEGAELEKRSISVNGCETMSGIKLTNIISKILVCSVLVVICLAPKAASSYRPEPENLCFVPLAFPDAKNVILLTEKGVNSFGKLKPLLETLGTLQTVAKDNKPCVVLGGVPFLRNSPPEVIILSEQNPQVTISVSKRASAMYFLVGAGNLEKDFKAQCRIYRNDGMVINLEWKKSWNICSSIGKVNTPSGFVEESKKPNTSTQIIWKDYTENGVPLRLFRTTWVNDNEWYSIDCLKWKLKDGFGTFLILGITAGDYK